MKFINTRFVWIILSLIVFSLQINAQEKTFDESVLSESGKQAYQTILKTELFAMDGIGYGGESSEGRKALYELLKDGKAKSILAFRSLVKKATIEGGLYGLVGLKMWRCDCFQEELENFKLARLSEKNKEKLTYHRGGCSGPSNYETNKDRKNFINLLVLYKFDGWAS